jgi:hypothetical protein
MGRRAAWAGVENVKRLRFAAESGKFDANFDGLNAVLSEEHRASTESCGLPFLS